MTIFLRGQLAYMSKRGFDVTFITSPGNELDSFQEAEGVEVRRVSIMRQIRPWRDIVSLIRLYRAFRFDQPHIVNAGNPKAGLLGMLAAWAARVPVRIYTLHGLRLETTTGLKRRILYVAERIASGCAHRVICISQSVADEYVKLGLVDRKKTTVLGAGSSNGIDAASFAGTHARIAQAKLVRERLGISPSDPVIGYVGRLARDKGIADLIQVFAKICERFPMARLFLIGDLDQVDPVDQDTVSYIRNHPRITCTGFIDDVAAYLHAMNLFAFPSYREGFGNAVLEAQAAGLPVVGYRATGVIDAVVDGVTGRLVSVGAVDEMARALVAYLEDPELALEHGENGRRRALAEFSNERIWKALLSEYAMLLETAGLASPFVAAPHPGQASAA